MKHSRSASSHGIALVTVLLVMLAIFGMGVGITFLAQLNLRIAQNNQLNAIARYNAETGLDTALAILAREFKENEGVLPDAAELAAVFPPTAEYRIAAYEKFDDENARVAVIGFAGGRAEYRTEARLQGVITPQISDEGDLGLFGVGLVSESSIKIAGGGNPKPYLRMSIWSGGSVEANQTTVDAGADLEAGYNARAATSTCDLKVGECIRHSPPPDVPTPDFAALRAEFIDRYGPCTKTVTSNYTLLDAESVDTVICLEGNATLTIPGGRVVRNLVVIGGPGTTVKMGGDAVPHTENPSGNMLGVAIISDKVEFTHQGNTYPTFKGENTIVAKQELKFAVDVLATESIARTFVVSTDGDIHLTGGGRGVVYGSFWSGKNVHFSGNLTKFRGSVVAKGEVSEYGIQASGGLGDAALADQLENPFIPTPPSTDYANAGIRILNRR